MASWLSKASDIRMIPGSTAEDTLQKSRELFLTNSEWSLADIQISPFILSLGEEKYSQVKYFVSIFVFVKTKKKQARNPDSRALRCD